MIIEVNKKQAALENAKRELRTMLQLNKVCFCRYILWRFSLTRRLVQSLRKSIRIRLARWHEFRRHIALRCKIYFSYHLSNRGYFGKVLFDHVAGTLQLKVRLIAPIFVDLK
jgi:structural maintenance of chromosomes protein 6